MNKEQIDLNQYGVWIARGEDPNCDLGGHHSNPLLGHFEGKYLDVLEYCETLKGWKTWGSGGYLEKYIPPKIVKINADSIKKKIELEKEKAQLLRRLKELEDKGI
jgi:hypothetical protein